MVRMRALFYTGAMISERARELYGDRQWTDEELDRTSELYGVLT